MDPVKSASDLLLPLARFRDSIFESLPSLVAALLILGSGWLLAWLLRRVVRRAFRALANRMPGATERTTWTVVAEDQGAANIAAEGVYWLVLLTTIVVAGEAVGLAVVNKWLSAFTSYFPKVIVAAALVLAGVVGGRLAGSAIQKTATKLAPQQARSLARLTRVSAVVAALLIAAGQLGLDVSLLSAVFLILLAATLGAGALAFGLGARDVTADILAMHYVLKSYRVGQIVRVGNDEGRIVRTTATSVFLANAEGEVSIPGKDFMDSRCTVLNEDKDDEC